jgi:hypothetical protein
MLTLVLISIISISTINIPANYKKNLIIDNKILNDQKSDAPINEDPIEFENIKSADVAEEQQNHNFSLTAYIEENWTQNLLYLEMNSTKPDNSQTDWMVLQNTEGATIDAVNFYMINLMNLTSWALVYPSNFTTMYLSYLNESIGRERIGVVNNLLNDSIPVLGYGQADYNTPLKINDTDNAQFVVWNDWIENANISYTSLMFISAHREYDINTKFTPNKENTESDLISWEINYEGHLNALKNGFNQFYDASIKIEELSNFTVKNVLGFDGKYWLPLNFSKNETHISINYNLINNSIEDFRIELQTPNYLSIVFNDNLTGITPELRLYANCKIAGNLSIRFKITNGTILNASWLVQENDTIFYNFIMPQNATGGLCSLNVTLTNNSKSQFGVKILDLYFHKKAYLQGYTENTSAFSEFFVAVGYIDWDKFMYIYALNNSGIININQSQMLEMSTILNANVIYQLEDLQGELEYKFLGGWYGAPNISAYWEVVDLSAYQIPPGTYNLTFIASKPGYDTLVNVISIVISMKAVFIEIESINENLVIEEPFSITINLYDNETHRNFLMDPVMLNLTFTNIDTKEIELDVQWPLPVIQSLTIQDVVGNDTLPGNYTLDFIIDSEYYYGNITYKIDVKKKQLDISLIYDDEVDENEDFDIGWSLEQDNFTGNRENMTLEIYVDGALFREINLTSNAISSGAINFEFEEGDYTITYRLISPFYEAERIINIEAVEEKSKPIEKSWLEENWVMLLILLLVIIAMSTFGIYMTLSRRKVKAQRALESELIALRTKTAATEDNISLIKTQISQISGIYWILVIHSEQGTTMVEISDFRFKDVLGDKYQEYIVSDTIRDSALIGGFLTAIRNFSRETSGTIQESMPIFNSQTDYSTIVNDKEVHRRILEGADYFMAFMSSRETMKISDVLTAVNSKFRDGYEDHVKEFVGKVVIFKPFEEEVVNYLHNELRELEKRLKDEIMLLEHYNKHLKEVQEKIGIKKNI